MRTFRRIVHPTDFSPASSAALKKAVQLARANRAPLEIVHVLPVLPMIADAYVAATTYDQLQRAQRADSRRHLERLVARASAAGVRARGTLLDFGVAAERIARFARSRRADLVVMGTHGRTGLTRALLGSVAARVVAIAPCPVLTVRP